MTHKEIAQAFSNGKFEVTFPYLADNIEWIVAGREHFKGREKVIDNCTKTAEYFKTVTTDFKINNIIEENQIVVINGTAEFLKDEKRLAFISACDVYEFNSSNKLEKITSYCIE
ncbi:MAG: nuclear transport factor 2 family protein [Ignavibacteriae bacterium]|nr:nuclear transport factor 2 family protein [Ignavibacteriota bacterium]